MNRNRKLITEQDILAMEPGSELILPSNAIVTPLARQTAMERKISVVEKTSSSNRVDAVAEMIQVGGKLHEQGLIVATDGNLSMRLGPSQVLVTASGKHKGFLQSSDFVTTDLEGNIVSTIRGNKPTSELPMHLEVYRQRPDVQAVVHAHLPIAVALSIAGIALDEPYLPEAVLTLGPAPTTEYAVPATTENVTAIRNLIADHDAIVLRRHGAITVGSDLFDAYMKMEALEHKALIVLNLNLLGRGEPLTPYQVQQLEAVRQSFGKKPRSSRTERQ